MTRSPSDEAREIVYLTASGRVPRLHSAMIDRITRALSSRDEALSAAKAEVERLTNALEADDTAYGTEQFRQMRSRAETAEYRLAEARKVTPPCSLYDVDDNGCVAFFETQEQRDAFMRFVGSLPTPSPEPSKDGAGGA